MFVPNFGKLIVGAAALALTCGCNKSADEQQREALQAHQEADRKAREASEKAEKEINAARAEADRKANEAQKDALKKEHEAVADRDETVQEAKKDADEATHEATQALRKSGTGLRTALEKQLDDIDSRTQRVQEKTGDNAQADVKNVITDIQRKSKAAREELRSFENNTMASVEAFRAKLAQQLRELQKSVQKLEDRI